jgi:hypothetical protein
MPDGKTPENYNQAFLDILNNPESIRTAQDLCTQYIRTCFLRGYSVRFTMPSVAHANVLVEADSELAAMTKAQDIEIDHGEWRYGGPIDPKAKPRPTQVTPIGWEAMLPPRLLKPGETADFEVVFHKVDTQTYVVNASSREHAACLAEQLRLDGTPPMSSSDGIWSPHIKQLRKKENEDGKDTTGNL